MLPPLLDCISTLDRLRENLVKSASVEDLDADVSMDVVKLANEVAFWQSFAEIHLCRYKGVVYESAFGKVKLREEVK